MFFIQRQYFTDWLIIRETEEKNRRKTNKQIEIDTSWERQKEQNSRPKFHEIWFIKSNFTLAVAVLLNVAVARCWGFPIENGVCEADNCKAGELKEM